MPSPEVAHMLHRSFAKFVRDTSRGVQDASGSARRIQPTFVYRHRGRPPAGPTASAGTTFVHLIADLRAFAWRLHGTQKLPAPSESTRPVTIDHLNVGRGGKSIPRGIFEWAGDQARFCMALSGKPRPSDFSCETGSGRTLSQWKRKV